MRKRILQLDGGGAKGMIQIALLKEMEIKTGKPIYDMFDLIIGTSVGSIIGGILATGKVSATRLFDMFNSDIDKVFKKRFYRSMLFWSKAKYDKKPLVKILNRTIGKYTKMKDCKTKFICTAVCVNDGTNHYFKSWEEKDGELNLIDMINRSYAAPYYFEPIDDKSTKTTWLDGGTGNSSCSLDEALVELYRMDWINAFDTSILSVGTGYFHKKTTFKKSRRWRNIRSIMFFADPMGGGLARSQARRTKIKMAEVIDKHHGQVEFQRIDAPISEKMDKLDAVKYKKNYVSLGIALSKTIDYLKLGLRHE
jgi:hypothetical protein